MLNKVYVITTSPIIILAFIIDILVGDMVTSAPRTISEKFTEMKCLVKKVWCNEVAIF